MLPITSLPSGFPKQISLETAKTFLLDLGFQRTDVGTKAVYIDGHERETVVQERQISLSYLLELEECHLPLPMSTDAVNVPQPYTIRNA